MKKIFLKSLTLALFAVSIFMFFNGHASTGVMTAAAGGGLTIEDLDQFASQNFSNFEDFEDFEDEYTGEYDDFVDFGSRAKSFASQINENRTFTITYVSTLVGNQDVLIFGDALMYQMSKEVKTTAIDAVTKSGTPDTTAKVLQKATLESNINMPLTQDGIIYAADSTHNITCQGSPKKINQLMTFLYRNPTALLGFKLQNKTTVSAAEAIITIQDLSPFRALEERQINLSTYTNENTFKDGVVTVPLQNETVGDQSVWTVPIMPGTTTIAFYFGGIMNSQASLTKKSMRAETTIMKGGGHKAVTRFEAMRKNKPGARLFRRK